MPNITGGIIGGNGWENIVTAGVLSTETSISEYGAGHSYGNSSKGISFNASRCSLAYQDNALVKPNSLSTLLILKY